MKKAFSLFAIILGFVSLASAQTINIEKSVVHFKIGSMGFKTVKGTFDGMRGVVVFDPKNLAAARFDVCLDASTVCTGIKKRDEHLRNEDFFEVDRYPHICFQSAEIVKTNDGYKAVGDLVMHGVTRKVEIPFSYAGGTFQGSLNLKRLDYKVGEDTGTFMVSDEVEITIICYLNL